MENTALWIKFENHCLNEGLSQKRISKLRMVYQLVLRGLEGKELDSVNRENLEVFINRLNRNEFRPLDGANYAGNSKADIKKSLETILEMAKRK